MVALFLRKQRPQTPHQMMMMAHRQQHIALIRQVHEFTVLMEQLTAQTQLVVVGMVLMVLPIGLIRQAQEFSALMGLPIDKEATPLMVLTVQVAEPPHQDGTLTAIKIMEILTIILTLWILLD